MQMPETDFEALEEETILEVEWILETQEEVLMEEIQETIEEEKDVILEEELLVGLKMEEIQIEMDVQLIAMEDP